MSQANTIADFLMQSWAKIAMTKVGDNAKVETTMDAVWERIAMKAPQDFAKQGVAMASKDIGKDINPMANMDDNELERQIKEEEEALLRELLKNKEENDKTTDL